MIGITAALIAYSLEEWVNTVSGPIALLYSKSPTEATPTGDCISYWRDAALAIDMDFPMIVVNHPCSEEFGMKNLAAHLSKKYPAVPVHHIPQKCMYKIINNDSQLD